MTFKTNRIVELTLVIFIALFSFSIGTFVGKKYSDNQHRIAALEPNKKIEESHGESAQHEEAAAGEHVETKTDAHTTTNETAKVTHGDSEMTDAEVAKLAEEFSQDEDTTPTAAATTEKTHQEVSTHKSEEKTIPTKAAHEIEATKKPIKDVKEVSVKEADSEREIASVNPKDKLMESKFTVQVGSYATTDEAQKITDALIARGYKAVNTPATVKGKQFYRVQVGAFKTLEEAQTYKKELMEKNRLTSAFVQKIGM